MTTVACMGLALVDALSWPLREFPTPGKHPQVTTDHYRFQPGGGATNAALALAQLGTSVRLFAKVGGDLLGQFLVRSLELAGIDTSGVIVAASEATPFTFVGVLPSGERTFIHTPGANRGFTLNECDLDSVFDCDALLMPDTFALPSIDGRPAAELLTAARGNGLLTVLDETFGFGLAHAPFEAMLSGASVVVPSQQDLESLYPGLTPIEMLEHLSRLGAQSVVLKLGSEGCIVSTEGRITPIPAKATKVVDSTGAGDCFNAGLVSALLHGESLETSAAIATEVAAISLQSVGGAVGIPAYSTVRAGMRCGPRLASSAKELP
jgi:sugar/nucleoside kinase (ribokinase family)